MRPNSGSAVISLRSVNPFPLLRGKVAPQPVERRSSNALWGRMGKIERSEMAPNVRHVARSLRALQPAGHLESERSSTKPSRSARPPFIRPRFARPTSPARGGRKSAQPTGFNGQGKRLRTAPFTPARVKVALTARAT